MDSRANNNSVGYRIAVASGKGGTGKTTVATNLAATIATGGASVTYVDCDTEAPNGHLFLRPVLQRTDTVSRMIPVVDAALCTHCGACAEICRFNAILSLPEQTLVHPELCHSCGGCVRVCPSSAISEALAPMGSVRCGMAGAICFVSGELDVGVAASPPVVRAAKRAAGLTEWTIYDAPPGIGCPMLETVRDCDFLVLVTEPTPFGLHDLRLAVDVARALKRPCGVVINRADGGLVVAREVCVAVGLPVLAEIPEDLAIARAYSQGRLAINESVVAAAEFVRLWQRLSELCASTQEGARVR